MKFIVIAIAVLFSSLESFAENQDSFGVELNLTDGIMVNGALGNFVISGSYVNFGYNKDLSTNLNLKQVGGRLSYYTEAFGNDSVYFSIGAGQGSQTARYQNILNSSSERFNGEQKFTYTEGLIGKHLFRRLLNIRLGVGLIFYNQKDQAVTGKIRTTSSSGATFDVDQIGNPGIALGLDFGIGFSF